MVDSLAAAVPMVASGGTDWAMIAVVVSSVSNLLMAIYVVVVFRQTRYLRRSTDAQALFGLVHYIQNEEARADRRQLFALGGNPIDSWSTDDVRVAEKVCHRYDTVGLLVRQEIISYDIVYNWRDSITKTWVIAGGYVMKTRAERNDPMFWDNFRWLAERLEKDKPSARTK